jgi:hypothetical protein
MSTIVSAEQIELARDAVELMSATTIGKFALCCG